MKEEEEEEEKKGCVIGHGRRETCGRLSLALARGAGRLIGRREIGGGLVGLAREKKRRTGISSLLPRGSGRGEIGGRLVVGAMKKKKKETTSETMLPTGAMDGVVLSGKRKKKRKRSSSLLPRGSGRGEIGGSLVSGAMKKKRMTTRKARRGGAPMNGRADSAIGDAKAGTRRGFQGPLGP